MKFNYILSLYVAAICLSLLTIEYSKLHHEFLQIIESKLQGLHQCQFQLWTRDLSPAPTGSQANRCHGRNTIKHEENSQNGSTFRGKNADLARLPKTPKTIFVYVKAPKALPPNPSLNVQLLKVFSRLGNRRGYS